MNPRPSLLLFVLGLLGMVALRANPLPDVLQVPAYMASEDLTMSIGSAESEIHGRFNFHPAEVGWPKWTTTISLPVLVPVEERGQEVVLAHRWKLARKAQREEVQKTLFEVAQPNVTIRGKRVPAGKIDARLILPSQRRSGVAKLLLGGDDRYACAAIDARFAVIEFTFEAELGEDGRGIPFEVQYRQLHAETKDGSREARYVPFFVNLPKGVLPETNPHYRLHFVARAGVQLTLLSKTPLLPHKGPGYLIGPRDHEAVIFRVGPPRR